MHMNKVWELSGLNRNRGIVLSKCENLNEYVCMWYDFIILCKLVHVGLSGWQACDIHLMFTNICVRGLKVRNIN